LPIWFYSKSSSGPGGEGRRVGQSAGQKPVGTGRLAVLKLLCVPRGHRGLGGGRVATTSCESKGAYLCWAGLRQQGKTNLLTLYVMRGPAIPELKSLCCRERKASGGEGRARKAHKVGQVEVNMHAARPGEKGSGSGVKSCQKKKKKEASLMGGGNPWRGPWRKE